MSNQEKQPEMMTVQTSNGVMRIPQGASEARVHLVKNKADGTQDVIGMASYYNKNPVVHWYGQIRVWMNRKLGISWMPKGM